MEWLEKFENGGKFPRPIFIDSQGNTRPGKLDDIKRANAKVGYSVARIQRLDLARLHPCSSENYLKALGIPTPLHDSHSCFELEDDDRKFLFPAAVILTAFITDLSTIGERILCAGSLSQFASPLAKDGKILQKFGRRVPYGVRKFNRENVFNRYEWLTCFPSARRMWASVYHHASTGRMQIDLPKATVDISISGFSVDGVVHVTRALVFKVFPGEPPVAMAADLAKEVYVLKKATEGTRTQEPRKHHPLRQVDKITQDKLSFPPGAHGWEISPTEWNVILKNLKQAGFKTSSSSRACINLALDKLVRGHAWHSIGPHWRAAEVIFRAWASNGRWSVLESTLKELRQGKPQP